MCVLTTEPKGEMWTGRFNIKPCSVNHVTNYYQINYKIIIQHQFYYFKTFGTCRIRKGFNLKVKQSKKTIKKPKSYILTDERLLTYL